jgi:hypothetical protein
MSKIAAVLMVKNEQNRINVTLESVKNHVEGIVLYDTGSIDLTIECVKTFVENNNLSFHLLEGQFEDFSTSRNKMLRFADTFDYDFLLLLDSNDELQINGEHKLIEIINKHKDNDSFLIRQKWFIGSEYPDISYFNVRIIKTRSGFQYTGVVHEYIHIPDKSENTLKLDCIIIFQDRVKDNDGKTKNRWTNDLQLLEKEILKDPLNTRTQFYLAQTYSCLNKNKRAQHYYRKRAKNTNGYYEERFVSMTSLASMANEEHEKIRWNLNAFQVIKRAEPLINISRIYRLKNQHHLAFAFAHMACMLDFPSYCNFLVDEKCYSHDRWHELGIVSYYVAEDISLYNQEEANKIYMIGKKACENAIRSGYLLQTNSQNLSFYIDKCKESTSIAADEYTSIAADEYTSIAADESTSIAANESSTSIAADEI